MWKTIFGFEKYEINEKGFIQHKTRQQILTPQLRERGYWYIGLMTDNSRLFKVIGRLVWETFNNKKCENQIGYKDGNPGNYQLSNLYCEKCIKRNRKTPKNKYQLTDEIKKEILTSKITIRQIWKQYGIPTNYMSNVIRRQSWQHLLENE